MTLADGAYFLRARLNVSLPGVRREVAKALLDPGLPPNSGAFRPLEVITRPGTLLEVDGSSGKVTVLEG